MSRQVAVTFYGGTPEQHDEIRDFIARDPWRNADALVEAGVLMKSRHGGYVANLLEAEPSEDRV